MAPGEYTPPKDRKVPEKDDAAPFVDYRDWLASVVLRSYAAAKAPEEKMVRGLISAGEASSEAEAREFLNELFKVQVENKRPKKRK